MSERETIIDNFMAQAFYLYRDLTGNHGIKRPEFKIDDIRKIKLRGFIDSTYFEEKVDKYLIQEEKYIERNSNGTVSISRNGLNNRNNPRFKIAPNW
jgi:hypothetical protein